MRIDPLTVRVSSPIDLLADALRALYGHREVLAEDAFADFHIALARPKTIRRFIQQQVCFEFDGMVPFKPLPLSQTYPMFEWGLNWCIASQYHRFVMVHAAVIERDGFVVVMPGEPGAGKSTLCAALVSRGWRLFSDEMALITPLSAWLTPIPRPICLKNASIDLMRQFAPDHYMGKVFRDTRKGDVAHMGAPEDAVARAAEPGEARFVIFPRYRAHAPLSVQPVAKPEAVLRLAEQCFNYSQFATEGFHTLCNVVDRSHCHAFEYSRLDDAIDYFAALKPGRPS